MAIQDPDLDPDPDQSAFKNKINNSMFAVVVEEGK